MSSSAQDDERTVLAAFVSQLSVHVPTLQAEYTAGRMTRAQVERALKSALYQCLEGVMTRDGFDEIVNRLTFDFNDMVDTFLDRST